MNLLSQIKKDTRLAWDACSILKSLLVSIDSNLQSVKGRNEHVQEGNIHKFLEDMGLAVPAMRARHFIEIPV
jgi:hypothetical protein